MGKEVTTLAVSDGFCELFGYKDHNRACSDMNLNMYKNTHPDDTARVTNAILRFGPEDGRLDVVYRTRKNDDSGYKIIHMIGEYAGENEGMHLGQIWFTDEGDYRGENGTDLKRGFSRAVLEESLDHSIRYDYLTGLPNLTSFFEISEIGRKVMLEQGGLPALLYIDLSGMKSYNHKYGFSEGDRLTSTLWNTVLSVKMVKCAGSKIMAII
jgi:hypothetical protein